MWAQMRIVSRVGKRILNDDATEFSILYVIFEESAWAYSRSRREQEGLLFEM